MEHLIIQDNSKDLIHAIVGVRTGWQHEETNRRGIAHFLEHAIFLGNRRYPSPDNETRRYGVELQGITLAGHTLFFFTCRKKDFPRIFGLFLSLIFHPDFKEDKLEREKKEGILGATVQESDCTPWDLAQQWAENLVFDWDFALSLGTKKTLESLTKEDLSGWHQRCYCASNSFIMIYGDIQKDRVLDLIEGADVPEDGQPPSSVKTRWNKKEIIIERKGMKNVEMVYGFRLPEYNPGWEVLSVILGNYPTISKLWKEIFRGITYHVGSQLKWTYTGGGLFIYLGAASSDAAQKIDRNLYSLLNNPEIDEADIALAKEIKSLEILKMKEGGERGLLSFLSLSPSLKYRSFDEAISRIRQTETKVCLDLVKSSLNKVNALRATVRARETSHH